MIRGSQVAKIKAAVCEYEKAMRKGTRAEQGRCYAVLNAVYRNSSEAEIYAAIHS
jgi:hypothetical protein